MARLSYKVGAAHLAKSQIKPCIVKKKMPIMRQLAARFSCHAQHRSIWLSPARRTRATPRLPGPAVTAAHVT